MAWTVSFYENVGEFDVLFETPFSLDSGNLAVFLYQIIHLLLVLVAPEINRFRKSLAFYGTKSSKRRIFSESAKCIVLWGYENQNVLEEEIKALWRNPQRCF